MNRKIISAITVSAMFLSASSVVSADDNGSENRIGPLHSMILLDTPADLSADINGDLQIDIFDLMRAKAEILRDKKTDTGNGQVTVPDPETPTEDFIFRLYRKVLLCEPDVAEAKELAAQLDNHIISAADMTLSFMNHPDYTSRDISDSEYVAMMYNIILGREPDEGGYGRWCEKIRYFSRQYVLRGFIISDEFSAICQMNGFDRGDIELTEDRDRNYDLTISLGQMYSRILGEAPSAQQLNDLARQVNDGSLTLQLAAFRIADSELFSRPDLNDTEFVRALFGGLTDRDPDESELEEYTGMLSSGASRDSVLRKIAASEAFYELYVSRGLRNKMHRIGSNFKMNDIWYHFDRSGNYAPVNNDTLLSLLNKSENILNTKGDSLSQIYSFCTSDSGYKYIEATKTEGQIESIGWTYFADYAMSHYYSVCYYMAAEMDFLLEQSGYRCRIVHATHESGDHYWNQICIDGTWLNYDVTNRWAAKTWNEMVALGNYVFISYVRPEYK